MESRLVRVCRCLLLLALLPVLPGAAQQVSLAGAGPRFLYASSRMVRPIEIDVTRNLILRQQVRLTLEHPVLGTILDAISEQTGLTFVYSSDLIPVDRPVRLHAESISLAAALTEILLDTGVDVLLSPGRQVALVRKVAPVDTTGSVVGTVRDSAGRPLEGAQLQVEGTRIQAVSNAAGEYRLAAVPSGDRVVIVRRIGFQKVSRRVTVPAGAEVTLDIGLKEVATVLDELVTTGSLIPTEIKALPSPITVVSSEEIELLHPRRFDELIRLAVPGAVAWEPAADGSNPGVMGLAFRGASSLFLSVDQGSSNPKIFVDGVEVTGGAYGYYPQIDPQTIERVEVLRGPQASAVYGSDAMGGVIQIFTKRGLAGQPVRIDGQTALSTIQSKFPESGALRQEYSAAVSGSSGGASFRIGGGYRRTGEWMPDYRERNPYLDGSMHFEQGPLTVNLNGRYETNTSERGLNKLTNPLIGTPYCNAGCSSSSGFRAENKQETYSVQVGLRATSWWSHEVQVGVDRTNLISTKYKPTVGDSTLSRGENVDTRTSVAYRTTLKGPLTPALVGTLISGVDHWTSIGTYASASGLLSFRPYRFGPNGSNSTAYHRETNTGIFSQAQLALYDAWFLLGSLRFEDNSEFGEHVNWPSSTRLGLTHVRDLGRNLTLKLRASYGQAIRPPSPGARDSFQFSPTSIQLPNRDLREQRQFGPDGGFDLVFGGHGSLGVTYYHQIAKDFQYFTFNYDPATNTATYKNVNLARVKNTGWEIEGAFQGRWVSGRATLGITRTRPTDLGGITPQPDLKVGQQITGYPERTASLAVSVSPISRTTVTLAAAYHSSTRGYDQAAAIKCLLALGPCRGDPNQPFSYGNYIIPIHGITKLNAAIDQEIRRNLSAFLNVEDLTNTGGKRAVNNYSQLPGRITTLGVRVRY